jgi:plastocyanin
MRARPGRAAAGAVLRATFCLALAAAPTAGCTWSNSPNPLRPNEEPSFTVGPDGILRLVDDPTTAYGVTAIDYHFHDAHPTLPLAPDRTIVVTNEGRVRHNVSIPGTGFSKDIEPGDRIVLRDVGELFGGPGTHVFICRFHASLGMRGTVVVADR